MSMPCEKCKGKSTVKDSRLSDNIIRRRLLCLECGHKFTTGEFYVTGMIVGNSKSSVRKEGIRQISQLNNDVLSPLKKVLHDAILKIESYGE
jgi:transcriptional regulator NrdR family protein